MIDHYLRIRPYLDHNVWGDLLQILILIPALADDARIRQLSLNWRTLSPSVKASRKPTLHCLLRGTDSIGCYQNILTFHRSLDSSSVIIDGVHLRMLSPRYSIPSRSRSMSNSVNWWYYVHSFEQIQGGPKTQLSEAETLANDEVPSSCWGWGRQHRSVVLYCTYSTYVSYSLSPYRILNPDTASAFTSFSRHIVISPISIVSYPLAC